MIFLQLIKLNNCAPTGSREISRMLIIISACFLLAVTKAEESCLHSGENDDLRAVESLIDLEKYPIHRPSSLEYSDLIEFCQTQLKKVGSVDLPGFIRSSVLEEMAAEVDNLPSYNRLNVVSAYGAALDDEPVEINQTMTSWNGQDHPAKRKFAQDVFAVAGDQIPLTALIRKVYDSPLVMRFLAAASGRKEMYQMDDEVTFCSGNQTGPLEVRDALDADASSLMP